MKSSNRWCGLSGVDLICRKSWMTVCVAVLMMAASMASQTTQRANRITLNAQSSAPVKIVGSVHPATRRATDLGPVNASLKMETMSFQIGLSAAQQTELDALIAAQQNRSSMQYHQWLTQEEFGARFGLTDADLKAVTSWLASQGFAVKSVSPSRNLITFSGTAAQAESAFRTQIHEFQLDGEKHIGNTEDVSIPRAFAGVVTHIGGLNGFRPKARLLRPKADFTSSISGKHFLTPKDWATIYDVNPLYAEGYTGTGMRIAIMGQTYIPLADITAFRTAAGLPAANLNYVCITTPTTECTNLAAESLNDITEADLDVEWSGGIAYNATVDFIYESHEQVNGNGVYDALTYAISTYNVNGAVDPVISMSYGSCESDVNDNSQDIAFRKGMDGYLAEAAAQGQTVLNSSGDDGAAGCDNSQTATPITVSTLGAVADWPASSPFVTGVGGTTFSGDGTAQQPDTYSTQYWNSSTSTDIVSSALKYIPETSWNDTAFDQSGTTPSGFASSGGGVSGIYPQPTWQNGLISGQTNWRMVPDVAFSASPDLDGYLVCTENFPANATTVTSNPGTTCVDGFRLTTAGNLTVVGGTSASSPSFAGMLTLLGQKYSGLQGSLNQTLYGFAANATTYASVFNDITSGDNKQPCSTGTGCTGGLVGYDAVAGYDMVTGLGSVNAGAMDSAVGTSNGSNGAASYAIQASTTATTISTGSNGTVTITLTPSSSYSGSVNLTAISSSTNVTATLNLNAVPLGAGAQTVTLTIAANASASKPTPAMPWKNGGAVMLAAMLLGVPLRQRLLRKRVMAVLLTALAISLAGLLMACGGGGSSSTKNITPATQTYTVSVSARGTNSTNPAPLVITVTVP